MNFAVFASGNGTNLQAIIDAVKRKEIGANLCVVISDKPDAYAITRAKEAGIKAVIINPKDFLDKEAFEAAVSQCLRKEKADFIVLAGFMRILSPAFVKEFKNKILNIHPSLLPSFKGAHAIQDAFEAKAKTTGVTIHFVAPEVDSGPIILQEPVEISPQDTLAALEEKIHAVEHTLYPKTIDLYAKGQIKISGKKVEII